MQRVSVRIANVYMVGGHHRLPLAEAEARQHRARHGTKIPRRAPTRPSARGKRHRLSSSTTDFEAVRCSSTAVAGLVADTEATPHT